MLNPLSLTIQAPQLTTEVIFEKGMLDQHNWFSYLREVSHQYALIADRKIQFLGEYLTKKLLREGFEVLFLPIDASEANKSREQKEFLEEQLIEHHMGRETAVLALGGGVTTDLAGFVAATYCRGIPLLSIPTTLLGMVDASLGGKVAINTKKGKNMIGAFHHPRYVFIDTATLTTLPQSEKLKGFSEMIKYSLIGSEELFEAFSAKNALEQMDDRYIRLCCEIKMGVVKQDPHEKGLRRILNFGHTVGHALEVASGYQLAHGYAIAIGMIAESFLSYRLGYLSENTFDRIESLIRGYGFPLHIPTDIGLEQCMENLRRDKKTSLKATRCVILKGIGQVAAFDGDYCTEITSELWCETFQWCYERF